MRELERAGKRLRPRKEKLSVEVAVERRPGSNLAAAWVFQTPLESRDLRQPRVSAESPRSYAAAPEASFDCQSLPESLYAL